MSKTAPAPKIMRTTYDFVREAENVSSDTRTIPDDSFSIVDLFNRYRVGAPLPPGLERPVTFSELASHEDLDMSYVSRLDLVEIAQLRNRVNAQYEALKTREAQLRLNDDDQTTTKMAPKSEPPAPPKEA